TVTLNREIPKLEFVDLLINVVTVEVLFQQVNESFLVADTAAGIDRRADDRDTKNSRRFLCFIQWSAQSKAVVRNGDAVELKGHIGVRLMQEKAFVLVIQLSCGPPTCGVQSHPHQ